jgi:SAM-dependent methyltransferase
MKDGREKVGPEVLALMSDHAMMATLQKMRRLALPFGPPEAFDGDRRTVHEHYIREIPLANGGLGCALWDGGLVLARWIYGHGNYFSGKSVLELGCGVGLAGIMAAHWASKVVLTDYVESTVDNARYNARLNSAEPGTTFETVCGAQYSREILSRVTARVLDWDAEASAAEEGSPFSGPFCSTSTGIQPWYSCETCWPGDSLRGCCLACSGRCHEGHALTQRAPEKFTCDCKTTGRCMAVVPPPRIEPVDIIIGSELTYNLLSCASLARVIHKYLRPSGVFYEVLSDDRDGVSVFVAEMERLGFTTVRCPVHQDFCQNFGTRTWSKQHEERYSFFTWRRAAEPPDHSLPDMES